ncbi:mitochondrial ribosomal subunit protein-domain-containing protein [Phakopsora pachyrhizi]|nr:mitochondrial ribosomal subunit protein-domain-containing protein [Phakopsora pachyrhizi]
MNDTSICTSLQSCLLQPTVGPKNNRDQTQRNSCKANNHQIRSFGSSYPTQAGGKNKIKVSGKGKLKDHRLGGPGMEEVFDIERDLAKPFAMQDVPGVTHLRWDEARRRLKALRMIKYQMPLLAKHKQPFVPPPPEAHVIVKTHDDLGFCHGKKDSQRPNQKVTIQVNLSKLKVLRDSAGGLHKFKLLSGRRWFAPKPKSELDLNDHYDDPDGMVKISCDRFSNRFMNERWCSDTLDRLLEESVRLGDDSMDDIPLDDRVTLRRRKRDKNRPWTVNPEHSPKFPKQWLTDKAIEKIDRIHDFKKAVLIQQKAKLLKADQELRGLIKWDGVGVAPVGMFERMDQDLSQKVEEIVERRKSIRDLTSFFDDRSKLEEMSKDRVVQ